MTRQLLVVVAVLFNFSGHLPTLEREDHSFHSCSVLVTSRACRSADFLQSFGVPSLVPVLPPELVLTKTRIIIRICLENSLRNMQSLFPAFDTLSRWGSNCGAVSELAGKLFLNQWRLRTEETHLADVLEERFLFQPLFRQSILAKTLRRLFTFHKSRHILCPSRQLCCFCMRASSDDMNCSKRVLRSHFIASCILYATTEVV